jgi:hypothetical protein
MGWWSLSSGMATVTGRSDRLSDLPKRVATIPEKPTLVALLPFVNMTFSHISHMLSRHIIKSVSLPPRKIANFLRPVKDTWD